MNKRVLFCATIDEHFTSFHIPYLKWFKEQGWEVHVAAAGNLKIPYVDKKYHICIERSPFNTNNIKAFNELTEIIDQNEYDIIHCHTPMGGVLTRLAAKKARKKGTKVIYTAHGFHFCKGAPFINWLIYYPIEKTLSYMTDCLLTINEEDFALAKSKFKAKQIVHIHGVGVDTERFAPILKFHKKVLRAQYHYENDAFLMFYAAEFNKNKNQELLIESLPLIKKHVPNIKLVFAGDGPLVEHCKQLSKRLEVEQFVDFLGQREDIDSLLKMSDIAVASSIREGLPVNIMEAMACGLPIIAVDNRGHRELISDNVNGWLVENNKMQIADKTVYMALNKPMRMQLGVQSRKIILAKYSLNKVLEEKKVIYKNVMDEMEDVQWAVH
ncbi:glycosyltransferase family 4 protein [Lederbergia panacisoli]|uniref:glycosyltransferase family 4 protein n=1 Tax=Lederbergia panacisoli TaxID=1255251 RepID=UPI00214D1361|nr:glycosyltransferase family 4 protein [Lederbergia panacisoli]MCR2822040.1 glycosyltransferase family 4 protein [Lederbergia panacisoli]